MELGKKKEYYEKYRIYILKSLYRLKFAEGSHFELCGERFLSKIKRGGKIMPDKGKSKSGSTKNGSKTKGKTKKK